MEFSHIKFHFFFVAQNFDKKHIMNVMEDNDSGVVLKEEKLVKKRGRMKKDGKEKKGEKELTEIARGQSVYLSV